MERKIGFVLRAGLLECLFAPGVPVDGVVGVLEQVRALLGGEAVFLRGSRGRLPGVTRVGHAGSKEDCDNDGEEVGSHGIENPS